MDGKLFTIEGPDGAGKSTLIRTLTELDESQRLQFTREPWDKLYIEALKHATGPIERALIFSADRSKHLHEFIIPLLLAGRTVVVDRYSLSSSVYQMVESVDLSSAEQERLYQWLIRIQPPHLVRPSHTYIILASPEEMYNRISRRSELPTHTIEQLTLLSEYYKIAADREMPDRYTYVYSDTMTIHEMATRVYEDIVSRI